MPLEPGTTLGPYSVTAKIGEGGMGEVYRARDTKLDRDVALKVLPEAFTQDPDRLARFEREAKVLVSLNHPNIGHIYGLEESEGIRALVLELVEGPTLADRIKQGPIPLDEALPIAKQIAEALEAAHEAGVIHRDLKPANVKVKDDGTVKVLDFGLAKAFQPDASDPGLSQSPTISLTAAATQMGMVIGTAAYMAPEQAKGKPIDKRADVWAFGAVLYEMLTGTRAFAGGDVSATLAYVISKDVDWAALPEGTSTALRQVLRRCLERDSKRRLRDIGDAWLELEHPQVPAATEPSGTAAVPQLQVWQRPIPAASVALVSAAIAGFAVWALLRPDPAAPRVGRFPVPPPYGETVVLSIGRRDIAITPDGSKVIYTATGGNPYQLYVRALDGLTATPLDTTDNAVYGPFISPDSGSVGLFDASGGTLQKISILGGPLVKICDTGSPLLGATWTEDDTVIFGNVEQSGLWRVSASGGDPEQLTTADEGVNHGWPHILPGGSAVLFTILTGGAIEQSQIAVLNLETGDQRVLLSGGSAPRYASSGHLVYGVGGTLRAVPFDLDRLAVINPNPIPVLDDVVTKDNGAANFDLARDGSLVYLSGDPDAEGISTLVWVDREGREEPLDLPANPYIWPRLSPEGTRLAVSILEQNQNVWVSEIARGNLTPLTIAPEIDSAPIWTLDGQKVVFASGREGGPGLFSKRADGTGPVELLMMGESTQFLIPYSWSPDGRTLAFSYVGLDTSADIGVLTLEGDREWHPLLMTASSELHPAISPNGAWIAYTSDVSSRPEIYVERFPDLGDRQTISTGGGRTPHWSPAGDELFYRRLDGAMMVVPIDTGQGFVPGTPEVVFGGASYRVFGPPFFMNYDLSPDGDRFLMIKTGATSDNAESTQAILVQNWFEELTRLVPVN